MRNLLYINADGMTNCNPKKFTYVLNDDYVCEMSDIELCDYLTKHNLYTTDGFIVDVETGCNYGFVLEVLN